jgi:hypothetical protein
MYGLDSRLTSVMAREWPMHSRNMASLGVIMNPVGFGRREY